MITMSAFVQGAIVCAIVVVASGYAAQKLMPAAWRRAWAGRAASVARQVGASDVLARRVEAKLATGGACGSCESCRACAAPAAGDAPVADASARRIPIRPV